MKDPNQRQNPTERSRDLPDSPQDNEKLQGDEARINLPDVKDIPGQEFIHAPNMTEFADTTISSADEEGDGVWEDNKATDGATDVTPLEKEMLRASAEDMPTRDEQQLRRATLDDRDDDGDLLNERSSASAISGSDLDIPGADDEIDKEDLGQGDEENNSYSLGGDDQSINEERSGT